MFTIITKVKENEWKKFLARYKGATIYHTPEWKTFLEKTFSYKSYYLFAEDESMEVVGLFPLFYVKSKLTRNRFCSVPFSHICGPIGNEDILSDLINEVINLNKDFNNNFLEIRDYVAFTGFQYLNIFSTHILELSPNIEEVWKKLSKGSVRWAIKKSQKLGISIKNTKNVEDLKVFYELNCMTKQKIGVPSHHWKFFKNLFNFLNKNVTLYIAKYKEEIIGGGIMLYFKDTVYYGYGAANPRYLKFHPYNAFIWKSIEDACLKKYKYFDFGRTSYDNLGLFNFKKRWGTMEKKLYYSYYPKYSKSLIGNRNNWKYKFGTKLLRKIPMAIYKKFSNMVFGNFG